MRQGLDRFADLELRLRRGGVEFTSHHVVLPDGVRIHARDYAGPGDGVPVVCLPGLTRNAKDFEAIAPHLAQGRRVICADFRGRGLSSYADPTTYHPAVEAADTFAVLDQLGVGRVAILGTSRGGIVAMLAALKSLDRLAGVAFNDIGPSISTAGLLRIRNYLGTDPQFTSWDQAVLALKATNPGFETLTPEQWVTFARRVFRDESGLPRADYDAGLLVNFPTVEAIESGTVADLWELFDLMSALPMLVLRGEHSDLLASETVDEMQRRAPGLAAVTVKDRGHVPFLDEPESIAALDTWLGAVDGRS